MARPNKGHTLLLKCIWLLHTVYSFIIQPGFNIYKLNASVSSRLFSSETSIIANTVVEGPDISTKPDYEAIHGPLGKTLDDVFLRYFRTKMAEKVGIDSKLPHVSLDVVGTKSNPLVNGFSSLCSMALKL